MASKKTPDLADATFLRQTFTRALRQTLCPRCDVPMIRDLDATQYPVYVCHKCLTRWTGVR